uniref:Dynein, light chain, Tctex-type 3 n=1 Tax=Sinocyclocheilus rhinocerous TaxID=307959 RepID=A0A673MDG4_9TELE
MEEYHSGDEVSFSPDDASNVVKECIEGIIGGVDYSQNKVNGQDVSWENGTYGHPIIGYISDEIFIRLRVVFTRPNVLLLIVYIMYEFQSTVL